MRLNRRTFMGLGMVATRGLARRSLAAAADNSPHFVPVQPELFAASGGQPNCWADFDNDGDLDLFVGFKADLPNRLYRNDHGKFTEVAGDLGLADLPDTRAAAWGDFNADGHLDLYIGFSRRSGMANYIATTATASTSPMSPKRWAWM